MNLGINIFSDLQSLTSQLEQFWNGFSNNWMVMKLRTWQTKFWTNWSTESLMVMELFIVSTVEKFTMAWNSFWCTTLFTFVFLISLILCNISAQKVLTPPNSEIICGQNVGTKVVCGMILFFKRKLCWKFEKNRGCRLEVTC